MKKLRIIKASSLLIFPLLFSNAPSPYPIINDFELKNITDDELLLTLSSDKQSISGSFKNLKVDYIYTLNLNIRKNKYQLINDYDNIIVPLNERFSFTIFKNDESDNLEEIIQFKNEIILTGECYDSDIVYKVYDLTSDNLTFSYSSSTYKTTMYVNFNTDRADTYIAGCYIYYLNNTVTSENCFNLYKRIKKNNYLNLDNYTIQSINLIPKTSSFKLILLKGNDYYNEDHNYNMDPAISDEAFKGIMITFIIYISLLFITIIGVIVYLLMFYLKKSKNKH